MSEVLAYHFALFYCYAPLDDMASLSLSSGQLGSRGTADGLSCRMCVSMDEDLTRSRSRQFHGNERC
eukprot:6476163-Amphidinium_carterae.1